MNHTPLVEALDAVGNGHLVVVTGAGISLASGIPTFRGDDPDAVWARDLTEMGTYRFFRQDPVASWTWSLGLFAKVPDARPNGAHRALAAIEAWHRRRGGRFTLVTQNVDTLHEQAGSLALLKVHGTVDRVRCASESSCAFGAPSGSLARDAVDMDAFLAAPSEATLPRCPRCGDLIRQHVLWFDEYYADHDDYQWPRVQQAARDHDLLLFVGTSFAVGVTELFLHAARASGKTAWSVDPAAAAQPNGWVDVHAVPARAEDALPAVVAALGIDLD